MEEFKIYIKNRITDTIYGVYNEETYITRSEAMSVISTAVVAPSIELIVLEE